MKDHPEIIIQYHHRIDALCKSKNYDGAFQCVDEYLSHPDAMKDIGISMKVNIFEKKGDYEAALNLLDRSINGEFKNSSLCHICKAGLYMNLSQWNDALSVFLKIIENKKLSENFSYDHHAKICTAFIYAKQGDSRFKDFIDYMDDSDEVIFPNVQMGFCRVSKLQVQKIYEQNS